ncbi:hypothetical protein GIB67_010192 [Kingdonia uniflora]|uniref:RecA family profile 1 domain-containing protein n=1 Tax=Kingdonia uniflora TaxID=39325 RepID=A0A7J7NB79_9MAGN|nr:hypothetical protein GIB67_010192 [Kingdonia uniflora]
MGTFRSRYHFQKHLLYLTKIKILSNPPRLLCANLSNTQRVSCHSLSLTRRTLQSNTILLDCESSGNGDDRRSSESSNPWIDKLYSKSTAASPAFDVDELRRDDNVIEGRRTSGVEELSNGDDDVLAKDWAAAIEAGFDYGSKDESSAGEDCGLSQNESRDIYDSDRHLMTDEDDDVGEKKEEELSCSEEESMNESGFVSGDILPERVGINVIHGVGKVGVEESSNGDNHKSGTKSAKNWNPGDFVSNNKKGKSKMAWVCSNCGHSAVQWFGICSECKQADTMKQFSVAGPNDGNKTRGFEVSEDATRSWLKQNSKLSFPQRVTDVIKGINQEHWRFELHGPFGAEVARVLGGGLVPGSLVLVGGDPGVGKSTLILQLAALLSDGTSSYESAPVVYVSGEESIEQIGNRADRMGILSQDLFLYSCTDVEDILKKVQQISPRALIIDSIQTVYLKGVIGSAGSLSQVKECTSALLRFAKTTDIPVMLVPTNSSLE